MRVEIDEPGEAELLDVARVDLRERREALLGVGASMREPVAGILVGLDDARRVDLGRFDARRGDRLLLLTGGAGQRDQQRRNKNSREHVIPPTKPSFFLSTVYSREPTAFLISSSVSSSGTSPAASRGPSRSRACRAPSCPWPARCAAWRGRSSSTAPAARACSRDARPRRPAGSAPSG